MVVYGCCLVSGSFRFYKVNSIRLQFEKSVVLCLIQSVVVAKGNLIATVMI